MSRFLKIRKHIYEWLRRLDSSSFPMNLNYVARYNNISDYLLQHVHTEVEKGAIISQLKRKKVPWDQLIYLNNHGPGHVAQVIDRTSDILQKSAASLTAYEGYILLTAIQFHDVGNILGRDTHEKKCRDIMAAMGTIVGEDTPEQRTIVRIAAAHGGHNNGNPDTIAALEENVDILGKRIRQRFLAALLRFADELADDRSRSSRFMLRSGHIPSYSKLYHEYSFSLHSVIIDKSEISLKYEITKPIAMSQFKKNNNEVFLLDEIYSRTMKMHRELLYCLRYMRPQIDIRKINVTIEICEEIKSDKFSIPVESIRYALEEKGYPKFPNDIFALCPEIKGKNGRWLVRVLRRTSN